MMAWTSGKPEGVEVGGVTVEAGCSFDGVTVYVCTYDESSRGKWLAPNEARRLAAELARFADAADGEASAAVHLTPAQLQRLQAAGWVAGEMALGEWLTQRAEEAHADADGWAQHRLLLDAAQVPEHADPVEWVAALSRLGAAVASGFSADVERAADALEALRAPPKPLPTGPGQWWGRYADGRVMAWDVEECRADDDTVFLMACVKRGPPYSLWADVDDEAWTWLTRDGACVRCEPPVGDE